MSDIQLKPCPFCGGKAITFNHVRDGRSIGCIKCSASIVRFNGRDDIGKRLIEAWNNRTPDVPNDGGSDE